MLDNERYERKLRKQLRKQKLREKKLMERQTAKAAKQRPSGKMNPVRSFVMTFGLLLIIFTAVFAGGRTMVGEIADITPFTPAEDTIALATLIDDDSPFFREYGDVNRVNILLIGVNQGLTDTLMLASFDIDTKKVDVISIPRDTYYYRSGYEHPAEKKINAAYRGEAVNTARAVSDVLLGMPINYYAEIDYDGVKNIVDSMGGVPMDIPFNMVYNDPYDTPPLRINIPKGHQVLNGEQAVQFLRYRSGYPEGDMGRVRAQQEFVKNAFKQCISFDLPKITKTAFNNVKSDITLGTAVQLAAKAIGVSGDSLTTYTLPHTLDPDPPYYVYPNSAGIEEMIRSIYAPPAATEAAIDTETAAGTGSEAAE